MTYVAIAHGARVERCEVGSGFGLGVADREEALAGQDAREVLGLLLLAAVLDQRGAHSVEGDEGHRASGALRFVEEDELIGGRTALTAVLLRPAEAEHAIGPHTAKELPPYWAGLVRTDKVISDLIGDETAEVGAQLFAKCLLCRRFLQVHGNLPEPSDVLGR
jgi:hypothetical protein